MGKNRPLGADKMVFSPTTNSFALSSPGLNFISARYDFAMYTTEYEI